MKHQPLNETPEKLLERLTKIEAELHDFKQGLKDDLSRENGLITDRSILLSSIINYLNERGL